MPDNELMTRAMALYQQGELEGAIACFRQVGGDAMERHKALSYLGQAYMQLGRMDEAEESFVAASRLKRDSLLTVHLGTCLLGQGKALQAERLFLEALRREPDNPELCMMAGHSMAAQEKYAEAIRAYEQVLLRNSQMVGARFYLADALVRSGDVLRANGQLRYLLQRDPNYVPAILLLGDIAYYQKDFRQAIVEYCRAIALEPVDAAIYLRLGDSYRAIEDHYQAIKAYEAAMRQDESYGPPFLAAASLSESRGWILRARRYYQTASIFPELYAEAVAGLQRLQAQAPQSGVTDAEEAEPEVSAEEDFEAPQILTRAPETSQPQTSFSLTEGLRASRPKGTQPLDPAAIPPETPRARPTQSLTDQVVSDFDWLLGNAKAKLEEAKRDLLPKGLETLKGVLKLPRRPDR